MACEADNSLKFDSKTSLNPWRDQEINIKLTY
ncbi:hypothetical protein SEEMU129_21430 [Salmonella enterica subsp. enterica serovar Muenchen str. RKS4129]|nr:hypothetical protein SEEMU129_21430 [Salmonella enterica subsp. enterica serovar Muenchen str. RKS4129]